MAKMVCIIVGLIFLLIGIVGFFSPSFLGFHLSVMHSIIHLLTAAASFYFGFASSLNAARIFAIIFGAVYFLLGILGFVAPDVVANILQAHQVRGGTHNLTPDNILNLIIGAVFLASAVIREPMTAATSK